uniref:Uterine-derived 14 kDa protein n=1 Tax=Homo sapiens TaxID=9606 RepID=Q9HAR6_HUMAN|nr:uterine-derived 14 kDa protein [Homo sapiens]
MAGVCLSVLAARVSALLHHWPFVSVPSTGLLKAQKTPPGYFPFLWASHSCYSLLPFSTWRPPFLLLLCCPHLHLGPPSSREMAEPHSPPASHPLQRSSQAVLSMAASTAPGCHPRFRVASDSRPAPPRLAQMDPLQ